jgi:hypothetical protein
MVDSDRFRRRPAAHGRHVLVSDRFAGIEDFSEHIQTFRCCIGSDQVQDGCGCCLHA